MNQVQNFVMQSAHNNMMRWRKVSIYFLIASFLGMIALVVITCIWQFFLPFFIVEMVLVASYSLANRFENQWKDFIKDKEGGGENTKEVIDINSQRG